MPAVCGDRVIQAGGAMGAGGSLYLSTFSDATVLDADQNLAIPRTRVGELLVARGATRGVEDRGRLARNGFGC